MKNLQIVKIKEEWTRESHAVMRNHITVKNKDGLVENFIIRMSDLAWGTINSTKVSFNDFYTDKNVVQLLPNFSYGNFEEGVEVLEIKSDNIQTLIDAYNQGN